MNKTNIETLARTIDFSNLNTEIKNMPLKVFQYWLQISLANDEHLSATSQELIVDYRNAILNSVIFLRREVTHIPSRELVKAVMEGIMAAYLHNTWNRKYLIPIGKESKKDYRFLEFLSKNFDALTITNFVKEDKHFYSKRSFTKANMSM